MRSGKWLVFDVGGVILDWHPCFPAISKYLGVRIFEEHPVYQKYLILMEEGRITPIQGWQGIIDELKLNADPKQVHQIWQISYQEILPISNLINSLSSDINLCLCTNSWINLWQEIMPRYPVFNHFPHVIDSSLTKVRKPDHEIYRITQNTIKSAGKNILFIDDSEENIASAKEFGWNTYLFELGNDCGQNSADLLKKFISDFRR